MLNFQFPMTNDKTKSLRSKVQGQEAGWRRKRHVELRFAREEEKAEGGERHERPTSNVQLPTSNEEGEELTTKARRTHMNYELWLKTDD